MSRLQLLQKQSGSSYLIQLKTFYCNTNMKYVFRWKKWFDRFKLYIFQIYITILTILLLSFNVKILSV